MLAGCGGDDAELPEDPATTTLGSESQTTTTGSSATSSSLEGSGASNAASSEEAGSGSGGDSSSESGAPNVGATGTIDLEVRVAEDALRSTYGLAAFADTEALINMTIGGEVGFENVLEEIDLDGFEELGHLSIEGELPGVQSLHASDLVRVDEVYIFGVGGLTDLSGFSALEEVTTSLWIGCNGGSAGGLITLAGLEQLTVAPQLGPTRTPPP